MFFIIKCSGLNPQALDIHHMAKFNWACHSLKRALFIIYSHFSQRIINKNNWKSHVKIVIAANNYCLVVKVETFTIFGGVDLRWVDNITITDTMGKKRIDLSYPIWGKEVAIISVFSDNINYELTKPWTFRLWIE